VCASTLLPSVSVSPAGIQPSGDAKESMALVPENRSVPLVVVPNT